MPAHRAEYVLVVTKVCDEDAVDCSDCACHIDYMLSGDTLPGDAHGITAMFMIRYTLTNQARLWSCGGGAGAERSLYRRGLPSLFCLVVVCNERNKMRERNMSRVIRGLFEVIRGIIDFGLGGVEQRE